MRHMVESRIQVGEWDTEERDGQKNEKGSIGDGSKGRKKRKKGGGENGVGKRDLRNMGRGMVERGDEVWGPQ